jgi:hypothetical protein
VAIIISQVIIHLLLQPEVRAPGVVVEAMGVTVVALAEVAEMGLGVVQEMVMMATMGMIMMICSVSYNWGTKQQVQGLM